MVKLFGAGLLPASFALAKIGYTADDIARIEAEREREAADPITAALMRGLDKPNNTTEVTAP